MLVLPCLLLLAAPPSPVPSPRPTPPPVLEGQVVDPAGKPVKEALVVLRCATPRDQAAPNQRTGVDGRFRFSSVPPPPCALDAQAAGWAAAHVSRVTPGAPVRVALQAGVVLEGSVRDAATGQPIPGARVETRAGTPLTWDPAAGVLAVTTDVRGAFRLTDLRPGTRVVSASARGHARAHGLGTPGTPLTLLLTSGGSLSGRVTAPDGGPVKSATVRIESETTDTEPVLTATDASGHFEAVGLRAGGYRVVVRAPSFAPALVAGVVVESAGDTPVTVGLQPGATVTGRLVIEGPKAIAGTVAALEMEGVAVPGSLREVLQASAADDGRFRVENAPAGALVLTASARGRAARRVDVNAHPGETLDLGDIPLETGVVLRGRVHAHSGAPIAGASVRTYSRPPAMSSRVETTTDADGTFVAAGVAEGAHRVNVSAPGFASARTETSTSADPLDITLEAGGGVTGHVVDDSGHPVPSMSVNAAAIGGQAFAGQGDQQDDASGRFLVDDLPPGTFVLTVSASGQAPAVLSEVKVLKGQITDVGTVRLTRGATVRGLVVDGDGAPVTGASVSAWPVSEYATPTGEEPRTLTDTSGAFVLTGLAAGAAMLHAEHPQYASTNLPRVDVDPGQPVPDVRLVMTRGARVNGSARRRDGVPLAGASVLVVSSANEMSADPPQAPVRGDGTFSVEHVPAGAVTVILQQRDTNLFRSLKRRTAQAVEGESVTMDFVVGDILVSGRVTRGGAPFPGVRLTFRGMDGENAFRNDPPAAVPDGPQPLTGISDADGSYQLRLGSGGQYMVHAERADGGAAIPYRQATVPDDDTFAYDLEVPGSALAGVVVARDGGAPVSRARVNAIATQGRPGQRRGVTASTGADGRFEVLVDPGEYKVGASAEGYAPQSMQATAGGQDLRISLDRGLSINGRVVDSGGHGIADLDVTSSHDDGSSTRSFAATLADGSFRLDGLTSQPVSIVAGNAIVGWGYRKAVTPGSRDATITVRPGGRLRVHVLDAAGQPAVSLTPVVTNVDGISADVTGGPATSADGTAELTAPAGLVKVGAGSPTETGYGLVTVPSGGTAELTIRMEPDPKPK